jgi:hypothetical protein
MDFVARLALVARLGLRGDADHAAFRAWRVRVLSNRATLERQEMVPAPDDLAETVRHLLALAWPDATARADPERTVGAWLWAAYRPEVGARWSDLTDEERRPWVERGLARVRSGEIARIRRAQLARDGVHPGLIEPALRLLAPHAEARLLFGEWERSTAETGAPSPLVD